MTDDLTIRCCKVNNILLLSYFKWLPILRVVREVGVVAGALLCCRSVDTSLGIDSGWDQHNIKSGNGRIGAPVNISNSSSTSDMSVACLQEKIFRMEESQYR